MKVVPQRQERRERNAKQAVGLVGTFKRNIKQRPGELVPEKSKARKLSYRATLHNSSFSPLLLAIAIPCPLLSLSLSLFFSAPRSLLLYLSRSPRFRRAALLVNKKTATKARRKIVF